MARSNVANALAARADRVSRGLEADAYTMVGTVLSDPAGYCERVIAADEAHLHNEAFTDAVLSPAHHSPRELRVLMAAAGPNRDTPFEDLVQLRRWARHRIVYAIDATAADAVADTDWADTPIPGEVLRRLPYPDPMVVLPAPIRLPSYDDNGDLVKVEKYEAFLITGASRQSRCSTHDPDVDAYRLHFLGRSVDPVTDKPITLTIPGRDGAHRSAPEILGMRIWLDLTHDAAMPQRQAEAITLVTDRHPAVMHGFKDVDDAADTTARMAAYGLAILVWLVTEDLDATKRTVTPDRAKGSRRRTVPGADDPTTVIEVGYTIGAALRAAARADQSRDSHAGDGRRTVRPHVRRAHLHRYWKGPRSDPAGRYQVLHWLAPTPVGPRDPDQQADTTQVHLP